jgi:hypothetical protein
MKFYKKYLYNKLYKDIDSLIKMENPCEILHGKCSCILPESICCYRFRELGKNIDGIYNIKTNLCCDSCKNLGNLGCITENLSCRIWMCNIGIQNLSFKAAKKRERILNRALKNNLLFFRNTKEEIFRFIDRPWNFKTKFSVSYEFLINKKESNSKYLILNRIEKFFLQIL